ncbi:MAG: hypothetical protein MK212_19950, partial [Saprospiraceae bacterium]|nr:hypothetical protein [Saprospiraceae bacterium]
MQIFNKIVYGLLFTPMFSFAQQQPHHNHQFCGVNGHMNQAIKEKMFLERSSVSMDAIEELQSRRAAINIPITFTNLGDGEGNGYTDIDKILDVFCALNDGYGNMNVHFHMKFPIRYLDNSNAFLDAFDTGGGTAMSFFKRPNSLNAYVGPSSNNPAASFYSPSGDYVFLLNSQIDGLNGGKTTRHEVGHFFSLPHTFSGWEGTDVISEYGCDTLVPGLLGFVPEYVERTGDNANCGFAGDGFCDTEADYYSNRVHCSL